MITVRPIGRNETEEVLRRLFRTDNPSAPLRDRGTWMGTGSQLLYLQNPIRPVPLRNLLQGHTPAGLRTLVPDYDAPSRVLAWQFTFAPPADLLAGSKAARELTRPTLVAAQAKAVAATLARFDRQITGYESAPPWEDVPTAIFAAFRGQGAPRHQAPVSTTVFFINQGYFADRTVRTYATTEVVKEAAGLEPFYANSLREALAQQAQRNHSRHLPAPPHAERSEAPVQLPDQPTPGHPSQRTQLRHYGHSH